MSSYSICIPRIFENIPNKKIVGTFERLKIGKVDHMDIVWKTSRDGSSYKMAFIHFSQWNMYSSAAIKLREDIENPNVDAKVVYDDPWYWIVLPNQSRVPEPISNKPLDILKTPTQWLERITNLEDQLSCIYEELYQREYIPVKYRRECDWDTDIETGPIHIIQVYDPTIFIVQCNPHFFYIDWTKIISASVNLRRQSIRLSRLIYSFRIHYI